MASHGVEVADWSDVDLRAWQEGANANVNSQAALDPLNDATNYDFTVSIGLFDLVPNLHLLGVFARKYYVAVAVFGALKQNINQVAGLNRHLTIFVAEFVDRNHPFGFVADVNDDL